MKKGITVLLLVVCFCLPAIAQNISDIGTILNNTVSRLKADKGISAEFLLVMDMTNDIPAERVNGIIHFIDNRFHFIEDGMQAWYDGKTQWTLQDDEGFQEIYISTPTQEDLMSINPYLVLQDNSSFDTSLGNTLKLDGKDVYEILLVEKEKDNELDMISIIVDVKTYRPLKVTLVFNGNQINSFIIKNYKTGQEFSDLIFVCPLSSFSEADIIDMR